MMRVSSVTDYILKLEKLNQESRDKIGALKELFIKSEEDKIQALKELNELKKKPTVNNVTFVDGGARTSCVKYALNEEIANHLSIIANREHDVYKARAYMNASGIILKLPYEVTDGVSCAKRTKGIGPSIAAKIDEFLDNYYNSDDDSDYNSDAESVASNDLGSFYSTDDESESDEEIDTNEYIADELENLAILESKRGEDPFRFATLNPRLRLGQTFTKEIRSSPELERVSPSRLTRFSKLELPSELRNFVVKPNSL